MSEDVRVRCNLVHPAWQLAVDCEYMLAGWFSDVAAAVKDQTMLHLPPDGFFFLIHALKLALNVCRFMRKSCSCLTDDAFDDVRTAIRQWCNNGSNVLDHHNHHRRRVVELSLRRSSFSRACEPVDSTVTLQLGRIVQPTSSSDSPSWSANFIFVSLTMDLFADWGVVSLTMGLFAD
jgi:hypothetical protein